MAEFLKAAAVYVHPSPPSRVNESFALALVEAMSLGVPSVCFRSGALSEVAKDQETGLVCSEEHVDALANSIDSLLIDPELSRSCGRGALQRYQSEYSREVVKTGWLKLIELNEAV